MRMTKELGNDSSRIFLIVIPVKRVTVWLMEETGAESPVSDMTSQKPV
jgi:hypothetical protein